MLLTYFLILGLLVGSFLNVCIYRIPRKESIVFPASHCANCGHKLKARDNIPLVSYLVLRGKCRHCHERISIRYPIVELSNALLWAGMFLTFGVTVQSVIYAMLASVLLVVFCIDLEHMVIPDVLTLIIVLLSAVLIIIRLMNEHQMSALIDAGIGLAVGGGIFFAIYFLTGAMGSGDVLLMAALGILLGWQKVLVCSMLSFLIASVVSVWLLATKKVDRKTAVPFGPYICTAAYATLLFGEKIINWYIQYIVK